MNKEQIVAKILKDKSLLPRCIMGQAFAPTNIALCKYWGKRENTLNLPTNSSLSITLPNLGSTTTIQYHNDFQDKVWLNGLQLEENSSFVKRLQKFLDLFRIASHTYLIQIKTNVPIAAGLASSACGFAAIVKALNQFYGWDLSLSMLSILSRLGSGSACRSLWNGFVEWEMGVDQEGMDSHGVPLSANWPDLCVAILLADSQEKSIPSRLAMKQTVDTSPLYSNWPLMAKHDLHTIKKAISQHDFEKFGLITESNALLMHALMLSARPAILYSKAQTVSWMHQIWQYRKAGKKIFFTQDAGPNLKLLFLKQDISFIQSTFPECVIVFPF